MPSLYVYYRVGADRVAEAQAAARRAATLMEARGVRRPRLMRRPEADREGRQTWMEVYEPWDPAWSEGIARALKESGLDAVIEGERHEELFVDLQLQGGA